MMLAATLLLLTAGACNGRGLINDRADINLPRPVEEGSIREAALRYQFDHNASGLQKKAAVYCLSLGGEHPDPSDEFMNRFANNIPPVRKRTLCDTRFGVSEKATGAPGLLFEVSEIKWISDREVEASGGYYEGGLSASGNTYKLIKKHGKWNVSQDKMKWIS